MLYTTYFSKLDKIPDEFVKLIITRFPPKWLDLNKYFNIYLAKQLAPSKELLLNYKSNNDWNYYKYEFNKEMANMVDMLTRLEKYLKEGNDVVLVCYEKDYTKCHRSLIAKYLENKGIRWEEFNGR